MADDLLSPRVTTFTVGLLVLLNQATRTYIQDPAHGFEAMSQAERTAALLCAASFYVRESAQQLVWMGAVDWHEMQGAVQRALDHALDKPFEKGRE